MSARPGFVRPEPRAVTPRQLEVLAGAAAGESIGETARRLFVSAETVKRHRAGAREALAVGNTARAVHVARERHLLPACVTCDDRGCEFCPADRSDRLVARALDKMADTRDPGNLTDAELLALSAALLMRLDASVAS
jgi:DNA-binding CsgD family transcriptional regulator